MSRGSILKIAVPIPKRGYFDYLLPSNLELDKKNIPKPGTRVCVPFGSRQLVGVLVGSGDQSSVDHRKLKRAHEFLDSSPSLSSEILECALRAARYYHHPEGEVLHAALPTRLRTSRKYDADKEKGQLSTSPDQPLEDARHPRIALSAAQNNAVQAVINQQGQWRPYLLHGVTGSGKTEVYKRIAIEVTRHQKQVLILVPEIGLTPQIAAQFSEYFGDSLAIMHSGMTPVQRYQAWQSAKSGQVNVVIGTRSAVFTPMPHIGLIVVDEEHDVSFKQHEGFRYSARDVAILRAQAKKAPLVLGSATPCLESLHNAFKKRYHYLSLPSRPKGSSMPTYQVIDTRGQKLRGGMSASLMRTIETNYSAGNQTLIFINKRGYARAWVCAHCGQASECPNCSARLVFHLDHARLRCHHCNHAQAADTSCPHCSSCDMRTSGVGTQQCTQVLGKMLPHIPIYRIDRDNVRSISALKAIFKSVQSGKPCALIGTQMLSKGHDFPNITLVAILDSDRYLYDTDFRASERFGQLIMQVAGRAGRLNKPGRVIIQTREPDNPQLSKLTRHDYIDYAKTLLAERKQRQLPPCAYMASINCEARSSALVEAQCAQLQQALDSKAPKDVLLVGPIPPILNMRAQWHRRMVIIYANSRSARAHILSEACQLLEQAPFRKSQQIRWFLDVDPQYI